MPALPDPTSPECNAEAKVNRWSTDDVAVTQKLDAYASQLESALTPMAVERVRADTFRASVESVSCGPLEVVQIDCGPHRLWRGERELKRSTDRYFRLLWSTNSTLDVVQRLPIRLRPGEMAFLDTAYQHASDVHSDSRVHHIRLPYAWLRQWVADPQVLVGRSIPETTGWGRALTAYASQLTPSFVVASPLPETVAADQLGALLALACLELKSQAPDEAFAPMVGLAHRIEDIIAERCSEPDLTPAGVAQALDISVRTLHRSLAARQLSFSELLSGSRAENARRMLMNPRLVNLTTSEIGRRAGFLDPSHFVRVMRMRVGKTPLQLRNTFLAESQTD